MKFIHQIVALSLLIWIPTHPVDAIISMFLQKYPYFKVHDTTKFDPEKYSKKLQQPRYFYSTLTKPTTLSNGVPSVMALYAGNVAISDHNGQIIFPRRQQTSNIYILVTKGIKPAYIVAPSTVYNWMLDPKEPAQNYFVEFKQDDQLELYYFNVQKADLPKDGSIPLNTIIIIADPANIVVPTGATITEFSPNLILPNMYIKKGFCFVYNSLYTLAIKQYFEQTFNDYQLEGQTISEIQQT